MSKHTVYLEGRAVELTPVQSRVVSQMQSGYRLKLSMGKYILSLDAPPGTLFEDNSVRRIERVSNGVFKALQAKNIFTSAVEDYWDDYSDIVYTLIPGFDVVGEQYTPEQIRAVLRALFIERYYVVEHGRKLEAAHYIIYHMIRHNLIEDVTFEMAEYFNEKWTQIIRGRLTDKGSELLGQLSKQK